MVVRKTTAGIKLPVSWQLVMTSSHFVNSEENKSRIQTRFLYVKQKHKNPVVPMDDEFLMVETCNFVNVRQGVTDMIDLG